MGWPRCVFCSVVAVCVACVCCCSVEHGVDGWIVQTSLGLLGGALALAGKKAPTSQTIKGLFKR
jgi:hypothetical protein